MKKSKKKQNLKNRFIRHYKLIALLAIVLGISAYGAYHFVFSGAVIKGPGTLTVTSSRIGNASSARYTFYSSTLPCQGMDPDEDGFYGSDRRNEHSECQETRLLVAIYNNPKSFTFTGKYTCGSYGTCDLVVDQGDKLIFCNTLTKDQRALKGVPIITLELADVGSNTHIRFGESYWDYLVNAEPRKQSSCQTDLQFYNLFPEQDWAVRYNSFERSGIGQAPGSGWGTGATGSGNGTGGTGTGSNGTGRGGGSGGSSATQQSSEPNATPSSSAQGDTKHNKPAEPSPFYDGKQYTTGSDTDERSITSLMTGKHRKAALGYAVAVIVGLAIISFSIFWCAQQLRAKKR